MRLQMILNSEVIDSVFVDESRIWDTEYLKGKKDYLVHKCTYLIQEVKMTPQFYLQDGPLESLRKDAKQNFASY